MIGLSIFLLGPPQILCNDQQIKVDTRKATALLAYLAVHRRNHRRDTLINLLWPDYNQSRGRTNLRRTLYALRKSLQGDWLEIDREEIGLMPEVEIWLDVEEFHKNLSATQIHEHPASQVCPECIPPLKTAVELYRGDFMSGFSLKDSDNFDEWQTLQTEQLRREYANGLERLVEAYGLERDFETGIHIAKRWLALDPLNEKAHCQLMRLYDWNGQRTEVFRQYETCQNALQEELGIPPQPATTAVYEAILKGEGQQPPSLTEPIQFSFRHTSVPTTSLAAAGIKAQVPVDTDRHQSVFVAREPELEKLNHFLDLALQGQGQPVFIIGDAGKGKTMLIQEFSRRALERIPDLLFSYGNCNAHTGLGDPYLPFLEILGLLTGDIDALWAAGTISQQQSRLLWDAFPLVIEILLEYGPDLIETMLPGTPLARRAAAYTTGGIGVQNTWFQQLNALVQRKLETPRDPYLQQTAIFEQYTRTMRTLAGRQPLLLVVDDLQWADTGSINLLFHLGRRLSNQPILLLGAYRPEDVALGRGADRHPLEIVVHEFQRLYGDVLLDLSKAEKYPFIEALLDSQPNRLGTHFRETLYQKTNGHPLFTVELLRGMQERGDLVQGDGGAWMEGDSLDWEILPSRIEAVIAERIDRLDERSQQALRAASVEGEIFTAEVLAGILAMEEREMVACLSDHLERRHQLVRPQEIQRLGVRRLSRYRFRHILFQNYLYHSLDPVERSYLHEAVGNYLEELYQGDTQEIATSLARHFQEAGLVEKAVAYLYQAGEKAKQGSAYDAAIDHLSRGLKLLESLPQNPGRDRLELELTLALGLPLVLSKGHSTPEVEATYLQARKLSQQVGKASEHFQVLLGLRRFYLHQGAVSKALELAEELIAQAHAMQDPVYLSRAYMMHVETLYRLGEFNQVIEYTSQGLKNYQIQHCNTHIAMFGNDTGVGFHIFEALALWHLGHPEQARSRNAEMLETARQLSHPFTLVFGLYFSACLHQLYREVDLARDDVDEMMHIAHENGFSMYLVWGAVLQGWAMSMQGEVDPGIRQMQQGLEDWKNMGAKLLMPDFMLFLAEGYQAAGRVEDGLAILGEALSIMEKTGERTLEAELYRVRGELLSVKTPGCDEAETCFLHAIQVARQQGSKALELRVANSLRALKNPG